MIRVYVICEGQTEEAFVNAMLAPFIQYRNIFATPILLGKPGHKGGNVNWDRLAKDLRNRLLGDVTSFCTTFFDYYALPSDFPGVEKSRSMPSIEDKASCVQEHSKTRLETIVGSSTITRFIPYVQMHEFEGLLFSDIAGFACAIGHPNLRPEFETIKRQFRSPEHINDGRHTAPSHRIRALHPGYQKVIEGSLAAKSIGLEKIRAECRLFDAWVTRLESLGS